MDMCVGGSWHLSQGFGVGDKRQARLLFLSVHQLGILCLLGKWQRQLVGVWVSFGTVITPCGTGGAQEAT